MDGSIHRLEDLRGNIFRKISAQKTYFVMCDISGCLFDTVDCMHANFSGVFAQGAVFLRCNLTGAIFEGAFLHSSTFVECTLDLVDFNRASLENSTFIENTGHCVDFNNVELKDIHFSQNDFKNSFGLASNLEILRKVHGEIVAYRFGIHGKSPFHGVQYEIGKEYICNNINNDLTRGCAEGLHVATLDWCRACGYQDYGLDSKGLPLFSIYEVTCLPMDIITPHEKDRFRVKKFKIKRELPISEWWEGKKDALLGK